MDITDIMDIMFEDRLIMKSQKNAMSQLMNLSRVQRFDEIRNRFGVTYETADDAILRDGDCWLFL